jgi:hypothetical protein
VRCPFFRQPKFWSNFKHAENPEERNARLTTRYQADERSAEALMPAKNGFPDRLRI